MIKLAYTVEQMLDQVAELQEIMNDHGNLDSLPDEIYGIIVKNFWRATNAWLNQQSMLARAEAKIKEGQR